MIVDLPEPEEPTIAVQVPRVMLKETSWRTRGLGDSNFKSLTMAKACHWRSRRILSVSTQKGKFLDSEHAIKFSGCDRSICQILMGEVIQHPNVTIQHPSSSETRHSTYQSMYAQLLITTHIFKIAAVPVVAVVENVGSSSCSWQ